MKTWHAIAFLIVTAIGVGRGARRAAFFSGGGSSAQTKTDGCASSICRSARADFDHEAPIGLLMLRSAKRSTTGPCGGQTSSAGGSAMIRWMATILRSRRGCGGHVRPITRQAHRSGSRRG